MFLNDWRNNFNFFRLLTCFLWTSSLVRQSNLGFILKGFWTIVFIFIVISTTFRPICSPAFLRCLSNSGTYTELRTTSFIESTVVACSDSVSHNRIQVLGIPVLLLVCSQDWTCNLQMIVSLEAYITVALWGIIKYYVHLTSYKGHHRPEMNL